ncbi:MAG TPA: cytochrome c peroxidase [Myxococcota bacterium]|nr:cytochrome c peroxidase [Myxococcota bacterium]
MRRALALALALASGCAAAAPAAAERWSERELRVLASLRRRDAVPPSPSNRVADDPRAASLGRRLFFDSGFAPNGDVACASCHRPERHFTDGKARSVVEPAGRNAPTIVGAASGRWFYWDGRRDSLWAQALVPFEAPSEIGGSRLGIVRRVATDERYRASYEALFGPLPDLASPAGGAPLPEHAGPLGAAAVRKAWERIPRPKRDGVDRAFSNLGKAIEAYERTLQPGDSRFDRYVDAARAGRSREAASLLSAREIAGLRLFIDPARTQCLQCHNGPSFTNGGFHNLGTGSFRGPTLDFGRGLGLQAVLLDVFNCRGPFSDSGERGCPELDFLQTDDHDVAGSFKTPSLRDVEKTAPYMHDGRFATLRDVLRFYDAPPADAQPSELRPLGLRQREIDALEAFLRALSSEPPPAAGAEWSDSERFLLSTLSLDALPPPAPDPGNAVGDEPNAAALGAALFRDARLSRNGRIACATCHDPERGFTDGRARAVGLAPLRRNAPSLLDVAWERWLFRDGRADSLWAQALVPIEHADEMGGSREAIAEHVAGDAQLRAGYQAAFATDPRGEPAAAVFRNVGKAIAAYERTLRSPRTRFDDYVAAVLGGRRADAARLLDAREESGLRLLLSGRTGCVACHVGPRFSDGRFHNVGTGEIGAAREDRGREAGLESLRLAEFRCAAEPDASRAGTCPTPEPTESSALLRGAFKTPTLRGLVQSAPYMHDGRFTSLEEVLDFYRHPPDDPSMRHELPARLDLTDAELDDLARFLRVLGDTRQR